MSQAEPTFESRLKNFAGLTAIVPAARMFKVQVHEANPAYPYLVWTPVGTIEEHHTFSSPIGHTTMAQWEVHVWTRATASVNADTQMQNILWQIKSALHGWESSPILSVEFDGETIIPTDNTAEAHRRHDYVVTYVNQALS